MIDSLFDSMSMHFDKYSGYLCKITKKDE